MNLGDKEMTNVVLVRHEGDFSCSGYLFETPVDLKKGQRVRVKTRRGEADAIVIHDSAEVDDSVLAMMATVCHAKIPLAPVIGVYSFIPVGRDVKMCEEENQ